MTGSVEDLQPPSLPSNAYSGTLDGYAAFLLLPHPICGGRAILDRALSSTSSGLEEDPLGQRGLARIHVGHDADRAQ